MTLLDDTGEDFTLDGVESIVDVHLNVLHGKQEQIVDSTAKRKIVKAGRRSGKTTLAADLSVEAFLDGKRVLYAVPTGDQLTKWWFEVKNALREPIEKKIFKVSEISKIIERPGTENRIRGKTAWNAQTLRGDFAELLILDELQAMTEDTWNEVGAPMLLDNDGDAIFIFTPPSLTSRSRNRGRNKMWANDFLNKHKDDPTGRWEVFSFTSFDNPHISRDALDEISRDMTPLAYRQEIMAEIVSEAPGALWKRDIIERNRLTKQQAPDKDSYDYIIVAVDPSVTGFGDETGIVVCGRKDEEMYVLDDLSLQGSPESWASVVASAYEDWKANFVVAESNQGGEMVLSVLKQASEKIPVVLVHASRGKRTRAEPISVEYAKDRVHHVGYFPDLEDECCLWIPGDSSPDHMDAMVWGMTYLITGGMPQVF